MNSEEVLLPLIINKKGAVKGFHFTLILMIYETVQNNEFINLQNLHRVLDFLSSVYKKIFDMYL